MLAGDGKEELRQYYSDDVRPSDDSNAGSTATVVLIVWDQKKMFIANTGDSRTVLSYCGTAIDLSKDHKPDDHTEAARIYQAGEYVEDSRVKGQLALSRAFGDFEHKTNEHLRPEEQAVSCVPDIKVESITMDSQFIFLACDGIWDVMSSQEVVDFIHEHIYESKYDTSIPDKNQIQEGMEKLFDRCLAPETTTP